MQTITIEALTDELHVAFRLLNQTFFDNELPEPAITIQSGRKRSTMGWCSREPIWVDEQGDIRMYEINISAEFLNIDFYETMHTLLHEMVHLYNKIHRIQDVSRGSQYHNKRFRDEALRRGLTFASQAPDKRLGFSFTQIGEETKRIIDGFTINRNLFVIARNTFGNIMRPETEEESEEEPEKVKKKSHIRKIVCPSCGNSVRASKQVNIRCDDCNEKMIEEANEESA